MRSISSQIAGLTAQRISISICAAAGVPQTNTPPLVSFSPGWSHGDGGHGRPERGADSEGLSGQWLEMDATAVRQELWCDTKARFTTSDGGWS